MSAETNAADYIVRYGALVVGEDVGGEVIQKLGGICSGALYNSIESATMKGVQQSSEGAGHTID